MALQKQSKQFVFSQGIDTKTNPDLLPIGKLHSLENARFVQAGKISKKNGSTAFTTTKAKTFYDAGAVALTGGKAGFSHLNGLYGIIAQANLNLDALYNVSPDTIYSYSPSQSKWAFVSRAQACMAESRRVANQQDKSASLAVTQNKGVVDTVYVNNFIFVVQSTDASSTNSYLDVIDSQTNEVVMSEALGLKYPKIVKFGNRAIVLGFSGTNIYGYNFDTTNLQAQDTAGLAAPITFAASASATAFYDAFVAPVNGYLYLAYLDNSGANIAVNQYQSLVTTGAPTVSNFTNIGETPVKAFCIFGGESNFQKIYVAYSKTGVGVRLNISSLTLAANTLVTAYGYEARALTGANASEFYNQYVVLLGEFDSSATGNYLNLTPIGCSATTGVAITLRKERYYTLSLASKLFVYNGINYVIAVTSDATERTYYLCYIPMDNIGQAGLLRPVAKLLFGEAGFQLSATSPLGVYLPQVTVGGSADVFYGGGVRFTTQTDSSTSLYQAVSLKFDFADPSLYQNREIAGLTYFNGGFPCVFDGGDFFEASFLHSPLKPSNLAVGAGGGLTVSTTYQVCIVFEYIDSNGNRHLSSPSIPASITLGGADTKFTLNFYPPALSLHNSVNCIIYRTAGNGTLFYREAAQITDCNAKPTSFTCTLADSTLITQEILYTTGNVIDNNCPTSTKVVVPWKSRIWALTDDGVVFSKQISDGFPAGFNPLFNINTILGKDRPIGIASLRDKFLVFYRDDIYYTSGDGPDDTGIGAFTPLELSASGIGAISAIAIIETKDRVFFQSRDGWREITQAMQINYIGAELQNYITESTVTYAANYYDNLHEIRISDGSQTYIYDTYTQQWSIATAWADKKAFFWTGVGSSNKKYIRVRKSDGKFLYEDTSAVNDDGTFVTFRVRTGWISMDQFLGFERLYKIIILGRIFSIDAYLNVNLFYDNVPKIAESFNIETLGNGFANYSDANIYQNSSFTDANNVYPFEVVVKPAVQKCQSVRIEIYDQTSGGPMTANPFDLTGINLVLGVKGVDKKLRDGATAPGSGREAIVT